jgi:hypothetical protein
MVSLLIMRYNKQKIREQFGGACHVQALFAFFWAYDWYLRRMIEVGTTSLYCNCYFFSYLCFHYFRENSSDVAIWSAADQAIALTGGNVTAASMLILWMSAIASAFLDNIPFVATMIPMIQEMGNQGITNLEPLWWSLALGACLGGNGTLIGASANLIAAGLAAKEGHPISFFAFLKVGFPLMLLSVAIASVYVYVRYLI